MFLSWRVGPPMCKVGFRKTMPTCDCWPRQAGTFSSCTRTVPLPALSVAATQGGAIAAYNAALMYLECGEHGDHPAALTLLERGVVAS